MFGKRKVDVIRLGSRVHGMPPEEQTIIPTPKPKPLKPVVAVLVEEFRNVQSELAERYEKAAKALLKNEDLASVAYEYRNFVVIHLQNDLVFKYFKGFSFENNEQLYQLKLAFEKLGIDATDMEDKPKINNRGYSDKSDKRIVLHIKTAERELFEFPQVREWGS